MASAASDKRYIIPDSNLSSNDESSQPPARRPRTSPLTSTPSATASPLRDPIPPGSDDSKSESEIEVGSLEMQEPAMRVSKYGRGLPRGLRIHHAVITKEGKEMWISPTNFHE